MLISIIVPVYNAVNTIEDCINSIEVAKRGHNVELIVMDGGSTDGTLELLKRRNSIDILVSEKDAGQYYAIHKGITLSKGNILTWLNGDDILLPHAISVVLTIFEANSDVDWLRGSQMIVNSQLIPLNMARSPNYIPRILIKKGLAVPNYFGFIQQEGSFWSRELYDKVGGLDLNMKLAADYSLWRKFSFHSKPYYYEYPLAAFRLSGENRSVLNRDEYLKECRATLNSNISKYLLFNIPMQIVRLIPLGLCNLVLLNRFGQLKFIKRIEVSNSYPIRISKWIRT